MIQVLITRNMSLGSTRYLAGETVTVDRWVAGTLVLRGAAVPKDSPVAPKVTKPIAPKVTKPAPVAVPVKPVEPEPVAVEPEPVEEEQPAKITRATVRAMGRAELLEALGEEDEGQTLSDLRERVYAAGNGGV